MSKKDNIKKQVSEVKKEQFSRTPTQHPSESRKKAEAAKKKEKADEKRFEEATKKANEEKKK